MCGICGFVSIGEPLPRSLLERMNATIRRRGPDGEGHLHQGGVGLAMRRLSIIDLTGGQQPIFNETGKISIVFNGEIYNYRELRQKLLRLGHQLRTESDTEVIVHLYEEYGADAANTSRGHVRVRDLGFRAWVCVVGTRSPRYQTALLRGRTRRRPVWLGDQVAARERHGARRSGPAGNRRVSHVHKCAYATDDLFGNPATRTGYDPGDLVPMDRWPPGDIGQYLLHHRMGKGHLNRSGSWIVKALCAGPSKATWSATYPSPRSFPEESTAG